MKPNLALMPAAELHKILYEWNDTARDYPADCCIHQLFEKQVERTPNAIALVFGEHRLTYRQLNKRANQLAHHLQHLGVQPEMLVGLCLERSLEMIVGLLGILKAGGAYLPLDPAYPPERLQFMLHDAQVSLLVTQAPLVSQLPIFDIQVICLDSDRHTIAQENEDNLISAVKPENLAYIIYTSGSTGQPKGVLITHSGVSNLATAEIELFDLHSSSRVLQFASVNFDVSVAEIFPTLCAGACLYLATKSTLLPGYSLIEFLQQQAITHAALPPSALTVLPSIPLPALQVLIVGGEACSAKLIAQWASGRRFFNAYGPTETTVDATIAECTPDCPVSIGRPIANKQAYILDEHQQPVPIEVAGELYIGGVGLARGYHNRPELTAEKFIQNPFTNDLSQRLYRTGDLARYRLDGNIEFLGRIDRQVKIRGFRLELEEIEAVLEQHAAVQQAVVIVQEDKLGDKHLVAYVLPHQVDHDQKEQEKVTQELIALWQTVNEQTDQQASPQADSTFNIVGWNSSYTLAPIAEVEMSEWVEQTITRIRALHPQKVLEIGCGTGLLLTQIAPDCEEYVGIDFNSYSLDHIRQLQQRVSNLNHIKLLERTADDLTGLNPESFDTVIINSVVQYFPNVAYLRRVLAKAVKLVKKGGHIFVGDVRNLALLETYCTSVETYRAADRVTHPQLKQKIYRRRKGEEELLLAPSFFLALQRQLPEITHIQIKPKRGQHHNELTRFRYEAILQINTPIQLVEYIEWLDWHQHKLTLAEIRRLLTETQPHILGVRNIPNARLQDEIYTAQWLNEAGATKTVAQLRTFLAEVPQFGIELEVLGDLSKELPYFVEVSWLNTDSSGSYDVVFTHHSLPFQSAVFAVNPERPLVMNDYANNPLQTRLNQQLIPQLRRLLQEKLPDYMRPTAFGFVEKLPLTPNDKVDREALAQFPTDSYFSAEKIYLPPRTLNEKVVAELFADVLELEQVGINDNFFELGGNSLKVVILLTKLQQQLSKTCQFIDFFNAPTVAEFAAFLQEKPASSLDTLNRLAPSSEGSTHYYPASFIQERFLYHQKLHATNGFFCDSQSFHLVGDLNITALEKSLNEMIRRHELLRTTLQEVDGELMQVVEPIATMQISHFDLQNLSEPEQRAEVERLTQQEKQRPIALERDFWWRVALFRREERSQILLFCIHNLIADDRSVQIFMQELSILYEAFSSGNFSPLPDLPLQYGDYARWQRQTLTPEVLQQSGHYWQQWLNNEPPPLPLPTDCPLPTVQTFRAGVLGYQWSCDLTQKLKILSQQNQATLFTTILAASAALFNRYSGCETMILGVPATECNHWKLKPLLGRMNKFFLVRIDLRKNPNFLELLAQVQQEMLEARVNQDLPFEQVAKHLQPPVQRDRPFFKVHIDFLLEPLEPENTLWNLAGLTVTALPLEELLMRADLALILWENTSCGTVGGRWQYKKDLFTAETMAQMAENFQTLLEKIVAAPEQSIANLPTFSTQADLLSCETQLD